MYPVERPNSIPRLIFPAAGNPASQSVEVITLLQRGAFVSDLSGQISLLTWKEAERPSNLEIGDCLFAKEETAYALGDDVLLTQGAAEARRTRALSKLSRGQSLGGAILEWKDTALLLELDGFHGFPVYLPVGEISGYLLTGAMRPHPGLRVNVKVEAIDKVSGRVTCTMDNCEQPSIETVIRTVGGSLPAWEAHGLIGDLLALAERFVPERLVIDLFRTVEAGIASTSALNNSFLDAVLLYANRYQNPDEAKEFKSELAPLVVEARLRSAFGVNEGRTLAPRFAAKGIAIRPLASYVLHSGISPILIRDIRRVEESALPAEKLNGVLRIGAYRPTFMNAARPVSHTRLLLSYGDGPSSWQH